MHLNCLILLLQNVHPTSCWLWSDPVLGRGMEWSTGTSYDKRVVTDFNTHTHTGSGMYACCTVHTHTGCCYKSSCVQPAVCGAAAVAFDVKSGRHPTVAGELGTRHALSRPADRRRSIWFVLWWSGNNHLGGLWRCRHSGRSPQTQGQLSLPSLRGIRKSSTGAWMNSQVEAATSSGERKASRGRQHRIPKHRQFNQ